MKNNRLEARRNKISKDIESYVKLSFDIVDRIHEILVKQGKEQKDLAQLLDKSESEISKWMSGTHNFTIKTITKIESILGESIIQPSKKKNLENPTIVFLRSSDYTMPASKETSKLPLDWYVNILSNSQPVSKYLD